MSVTNELLSIKAWPEEQKSIAAASITATYTAVGTGLVHPSRFFTVDNLTDGDLQFSLDGTTNHFVVSRRSAKVFDVSSNQTLTKGFVLPKGTILYVKEIENPTTGSVYFSSFYGKVD